MQIQPPQPNQQASKASKRLYSWGFKAKGGKESMKKSDRILLIILIILIALNIATWLWVGTTFGGVCHGL